MKCKGDAASSCLTFIKIFMKVLTLVKEIWGGGVIGPFQKFVDWLQCDAVMRGRQ
jgi:hypothetical protein